ncbi:serine hydrolase [Haladaptatus caseinilyticus]|uniref:serine hydrolase n=1 Tax=Haladaptatus caseinilyticus TaxID=2993314 RepID=UPI00224AD14C|nr:serine hydrolase [Haladaptatus caseinilyticus]
MATTPLSAETTRDVESFVSQWVRDEGVPGVSVAIVDKTDVLYTNGFGARNLETNAPATPETLYGIGSCTKSITTVAILQLAEDGQLTLDDSVDTYLPHLREVNADPITIHELLTHSSGMPSDGSLSALITRLTGRSEQDPNQPLSSDDDFRRHIEGSVDERLTDRDRFFYYNTGYYLLGEVIESVTEQSYAGYIRDRILEPLAMTRSLFSKTDFEAVENRMTPYNREDGTAVEGKLAFDERLYAAGGMISSVTEMANYLQMFLREGTFDNQEILSSESIDSMTKPYATREEYLDEREQGYGYGVAVEAFLDDTLVNHGGMMGTTTAWFGYLADTGIGVVTMCNTAPEKRPSDLGKALLAITQDEPPSAVVPTYMLEQKAEPLLGEYASYHDIRTATVSKNDGGLNISFDDPGWSADHYVYPKRLQSDDYQYSFITDTGKQVPVEFHVDDDGVSMLFQRWQLHKQ